MASRHLPPTQLLPPLPPQSRNTLSPIVRERISECIRTLRGMIVTPVLISGDVVTEIEQPKKTQGEPLTVVAGTEESGTDAEPKRNEEDDEEDGFYLDEFERSWAERWLNGVITRGEGWLIEVEPEDEKSIEGDTEPPEGEEDLEQWEEYLARERVLQDASELLSLMVSCTGAGAILQSSPKARRRNTLTTPRDITLKLHDAAIDDHTAVGVQTWGSCILLGRMMSSEPKVFFDLPCLEDALPVRILELGAGTGLISMLCHEILNKREMVPGRCDARSTSRKAEIIATDYHPLVLDNMRKCFDLNFPNDSYLDLDASSRTAEITRSRAGLGVMPLDWMVFPSQAEKYHRASGRKSTINGNGVTEEQSSKDKASPYAADSIWKPTTPEQLFDGGDSIPAQGLNPHLTSPFDMIVAADCVYDTAHAGMIRDCVKWSLKLPEVDNSGNITRQGGVLHLLSPLRPTYAEETISIANAFPFIDALPSRQRRAARRQASKSDRAQGIYDSGVATPLTPNGHKASSIESILELDKMRFDKTKSRTKYLYDSGIATPVPESEMAKDAGLSVDKWMDENDMGLGEEGGWVLCTKRRSELERMKGNGRSDEVEYWAWEISWA
ncbi:hypothetical protein NliqN6_6205 [Naganishia liquefaciens]|uniref:S-adenosyl-L-methionine-dependent methyltransferase n=1 Tax=Naganishia liquefaciens TaxID=104408 RepID=A0A8H3TZ99_9TREE|nr:hypothetical protein NliqN6_6205 [Naganishia liquefaciens]